MDYIRSNLYDPRHDKEYKALMNTPRVSAVGDSHSAGDYTVKLKREVKGTFTVLRSQPIKLPVAF